MPQQDLYIGLGSMAYALAKSDGRLQPEEVDTLKEVLATEPYGEIALYVLNLKDSYGEKPEDAYQFAFRRFTENRQDLDEATKKRFVTLLQRVASAWDGVSRKENDLLRRFRKDINRL